MKVRKPLTYEQLKSASGLESEKLQQLLWTTSPFKGIIEYNWENLDGKNPNHEKRYLLPMFVPGSAEFTVMNQQQLEEHPEIGTFFERMAFLPLTKVTKMVPPGGAGIGMHVIPVERAIEYENEAADVERISHWLKKYDRFSVGACSCRAAERVRGGNAGIRPDRTCGCIGLGDMADYCVETGKGHYATYDEVMDILILAERNGYVHQIPVNIDGSDKIFAICNCDVNVCYALRTSQLFNTPNMSRSAYVAQINGEKCVACAGCVEVCPAGAVKLGQKLLTERWAGFLSTAAVTHAFLERKRLGIPITRIRAVSSVMRLARHRARLPVLHIFRCRAICAWQLEGVTAMHSRSSSKRILFPRYVDASATSAARRLVRAARSTSRWRSMM